LQIVFLRISYHIIFNLAKVTKKRRLPLFISNK
jgi:hypothetical protein